MEVARVSVAHADVVNQHSNIQILGLLEEVLASCLIKVGVVGHDVLEGNFWELLRELLLQCLELTFGSTDQNDTKTTLSECKSIGLSNSIGSTLNTGGQEAVPAAKSATAIQTHL